jgi:hypothetical protein
MPPLTLEEFAVVDLRSVVRRLTLKEKVLLLAGDGWWRTFSIPRVGVPAIKMSDGPNGVRGSSHFLPTKAQTLPSATALGATFDVEAIRAVGGVLAREAKAKGSSVLLAPTCNIQRSPLNGRVRTRLLFSTLRVTDLLPLCRLSSPFPKTLSSTALSPPRTSKDCKRTVSVLPSSTSPATTKSMSASLWTPAFRNEVRDLFFRFLQCFPHISRFYSPPRDLSQALRDCRARL